MGHMNMIHKNFFTLYYFSLTKIQSISGNFKWPFISGWDIFWPFFISPDVIVLKRFLSEKSFLKKVALRKTCDE